MSRKNEATKKVTTTVDHETYKSLTILKLDLGMRSLAETLSLLARTTTDSSKDLRTLAKEMEEVKKKGQHEV